MGVYPMSSNSERYMGKPHESKPVTDYDKQVSKSHKAKRKELDGMEDEDAKVDASNHYNIKHSLEHLKAVTRNLKNGKRSRSGMDPSRINRVISMLSSRG